MKEALVLSPTEIPTVDKTLLEYQVSEWYYAKGISLGGDEVKCMVMYDFKNNKWCFSRSGIVELVEYYILN